MTLTVYMFGKLELRDKQSGVSFRIDRQGKHLLGYLLLQRQFVSREQLIGALWADHSSTMAHRCLSTALWRLRCALANIPGLTLQSQRAGDVGISRNADTWIDVAEFERLTTRVLRKKSAAGAFALATSDIENLEQAIYLYRGELLNNVYDDWVSHDRRRLHADYLSALSHLGRHYCAIGQVDRSLERYLEILRWDPLSENAHQAVMQIYYVQGHRALALQQYESCCKVLENELDLKPTPETRRLAERIRLLVEPGSMNGRAELENRAGLEPSLMRLELQKLNQALHEASNACANLVHGLGVENTVEPPTPKTITLHHGNIEPRQSPIVKVTTPSGTAAGQRDQASLGK